MICNQFIFQINIERGMFSRKALKKKRKKKKKEEAFF